MKLVVGLGNLGGRYENTRHNLGFMVIDQFAKTHDAKFETDKELRAEVAAIQLVGQEITLAKPQTMVNLSGLAVRKLIEKHNLEPGEVSVVVDDFNLPFGQLRVRLGGEDGGHNGLGSIIESIGPEFWRFRIGVASGYLDKSDHSEFVVSPFSPEETRELKHIIERAGELLEEYLIKGEPRHETIRLA